jgi:HSP20 family protein
MANLTRWNRDPWRTFDELFENWGRTPRYSSDDTARPVLRPAMDVIENDNGLTVRVDLPGLAADDVDVEVDGNVLTISGEMGDTVAQESEHYHHRERCSGAFKRSLRLADFIDTDNVEATYHNGVLTLSLPKRPEAQPKRIAVSTNGQ